jgi:hypothetical protein
MLPDFVAKRGTMIDYQFFDYDDEGIEKSALLDLPDVIRLVPIFHELQMDTYLKSWETFYIMAKESMITGKTNLPSQKNGRGFLVCCLYQQSMD